MSFDPFGKDNKKTTPDDTVDTVTFVGDKFSLLNQQGQSEENPYLTCLEGKHMGQSFVLAEKTVSIGRSSKCNIIVDDPTVSSHHASIIRKGNEVVIRDEQSSNGTYINARRIQETTLFPEDIIRIGQSAFKVFIPR